MKDIYEEVKWCLYFSTGAYALGENIQGKDRQFDVGEKVLIQLRPKHFLLGSFAKLHVQRVGTLKVAKRLGPSAYVIELPPNYKINLVSNIEDLTQFHGSEEQVVTTMNLPTKQDTMFLRIQPLKMRLLLYLITSLLLHGEGVVSNFYYKGKIILSLTQSGYNL